MRRGEHEPDRRRDHEAEVRLVEENAGRRQCVQGEEAGGREERERDEVDAPVAAPPGRDAGRIGEDGVQRGGDEHEPEVRRVVLPVDVRSRRREQDREPDQRQGEQGRRGSAASGPTGGRLQSEVRVHVADGKRARPGGRGDALDGAGADVAGGEDAGQAGLEGKRRPLERPARP